MGGTSKVRVEPVTVVEVTQVGSGEVSDLLVTSATVESERAADVVPQASGIVREVRAAEGDSVQRGQILAILENVSLDESATRARAELERLELQLAGTRRLFDQGAVSRSDLDQIEHQVRTARSSVREASTTEANTRLVAPFEGVIASRDLRVGQLASASTRAFQVVDLQSLRVVAALPERDVARVRIGQTARLVSAYDPDLVATAQVGQVAPVVDAQTGTFKVILDLPSDQRVLRPGQYVNVSLEVGRHEGVLVVPKEAVVYEDGASVVYRMVDRPPATAKTAEADTDEPEGTFNLFGITFNVQGEVGEGEQKEESASPFIAQRASVRVGLVDDRNAEIVEGLSAGERVVVVGQSNLKDGAAVKTPEMVREEAENAAKDPKKDRGESG